MPRKTFRFVIVFTVRNTYDKMVSEGGVKKEKSLVLFLVGQILKRYSTKALHMTMRV